jgi:hypothetical protein
MDRRDFLLSSTLAAATAATITSGNQVLAQTAEPGVDAARPNVPYEGSKLNRKLRIVNLLDLEPEAQKVIRPAASATSPAAPAPTGHGARTRKPSAACRSSRWR